MKSLIVTLLIFISMLTQVYAIRNGKSVKIYVKGYVSIHPGEREQCGGFLYKRRYVITAGHCVSYFWSYNLMRKQDIKLCMDSIERSKCKTSPKIDKIVRYPTYSAFNKKDDIAIIILKDIVYTKNLELAKQFQGDEIVQYVGFGMTWDEDYSKQLQFGIGTLSDKFSEQYCQTRNYYVLRSDSPVYYGDSGSPVFDLNHDVVAIVNKKYSVDDTIVCSLKIKQYTPWIESVISSYEKSLDRNISNMRKYPIYFNGVDWFFPTKSGLYKLLSTDFVWLNLDKNETSGK